MPNVTFKFEDGTATVVLLVIFYLVGKLTDAGKFDILAFK